MTSLKSKVRKSIFDAYGIHRSDSEACDEATEFRNSLNVLSIVRSDGLACPIDGFDFLFIGSIGAAYNLNTLMSCKISHILCVAESPKFKFPSDFICKRVVMCDNPKKLYLVISMNVLLLLMK